MEDDCDAKDQTCVQCQEYFDDIPSLRVHIESVQGSLVEKNLDDPYLFCSLCCFASKTVEGLNEHVTGSHDGFASSLNPNLQISTSFAVKIENDDMNTEEVFSAETSSTSEMQRFCMKAADLDHFHAYCSKRPNDQRGAVGRQSTVGATALVMHTDEVEDSQLLQKMNNTIVTSSLDNNLNKEDASVNQPHESLVCYICHEKYQSMSAYKDHFTTFHPKQLKSGLLAYKDWVHCHLCKQLFISDLSFELHFKHKHGNIYYLDKSDVMKKEKLYTYGLKFFISDSSIALDSERIKEALGESKSISADKNFHSYCDSKGNSLNKEFDPGSYCYVMRKGSNKEWDPPRFRKIGGVNDVDTLRKLKLNVVKRAPLEYKICSLCGLKSPSVSFLQEEHMVLAHKNGQWSMAFDKGMKCHLCSKQFSNKHLFEVHFNKEHEGVDFDSESMDRHERWMKIDEIVEGIARYRSTRAIDQNEVFGVKINENPERSAYCARMPRRPSYEDEEQVGEYVECVTRYEVNEEIKRVQCIERIVSENEDVVNNVSSSTSGQALHFLQLTEMSTDRDFKLYGCSEHSDDDRGTVGHQSNFQLNTEGVPNSLTDNDNTSEHIYSFASKTVQVRSQIRSNVLEMHSYCSNDFDGQHFVPKVQPLFDDVMHSNDSDEILITMGGTQMVILSIDSSVDLEPGLFKCNSCSKVYRIFDNFVLHLYQSHSYKECSHCASIKLIASYVEHLRRKHSFDVDMILDGTLDNLGSRDCKGEIMMEDGIDDNTENANEADTVVVRPCSRTVTTPNEESQVKKKKKRSDNIRGNPLCCICQKKLHSMSVYKEHFFEAHPEKRFKNYGIQCKLCNTFVYNRPLFKLHLEEKHTMLSSKKRILTYAIKFKYAEQFPDHRGASSSQQESVVGRRSNEERDKLNTTTALVERAQKKWFCCICNVKCGGMTSFNRHFALRHPSWHSAFICKLCAKRVANKELLELHFMKKHGNYFNLWKRRRNKKKGISCLATPVWQEHPVTPYDNVDEQSESEENPAQLEPNEESRKRTENSFL